jgi:hypothetical protein
VVFVVVTVNVDELPALIEAGLELMLTVGGVSEPVKLFAAHPVSRSGKMSEEIVQHRIRRRESRLLVVVKVGFLPALDGSMASRKLHRMELEPDWSSAPHRIAFGENEL